eukprot:scaffold47808_cov70-Phaeocystis_antarctica.AAC.7
MGGRRHLSPTLGTLARHFQPEAGPHELALSSARRPSHCRLHAASANQYCIPYTFQREISDPKYELSCVVNTGLPEPRRGARSRCRPARQRAGPPQRIGSLGALRPSVPPSASDREPQQHDQHDQQLLRGIAEGPAAWHGHAVAELTQGLPADHRPPVDVLPVGVGLPQARSGGPGRNRVGSPAGDPCRVARFVDELDLASKGRERVSPASTRPLCSYMSTRANASPSARRFACCTIRASCAGRGTSKVLELSLRVARLRRCASVYAYKHLSRTHPSLYEAYLVGPGPFLPVTTMMLRTMPCVMCTLKSAGSGESNSSTKKRGRMCWYHGSPLVWLRECAQY